MFIGSKAKKLIIEKVMASNVNPNNNKNPNYIRNRKPTGEAVGQLGVEGLKRRMQRLKRDFLRAPNLSLCDIEG